MIFSASVVVFVAVNSVLSELAMLDRNVAALYQDCILMQEIMSRILLST